MDRTGPLWPSAGCWTGLSPRSSEVLCHVPRVAGTRVAWPFILISVMMRISRVYKLSQSSIDVASILVLEIFRCVTLLVIFALISVIASVKSKRYTQVLTYWLLMSFLALQTGTCVQLLSGDVCLSVSVFCINTCISVTIEWIFLGLVSTSLAVLRVPMGLLAAAANYFVVLGSPESDQLLFDNYLLYYSMCMFPLFLISAAYVGLRFRSQNSQVHRFSLTGDGDAEGVSDGAIPNTIAGAQPEGRENQNAEVDPSRQDRRQASDMERSIDDTSQIHVCRSIRTQAGRDADGTFSSVITNTIVGA